MLTITDQDQTYTCPTTWGEVTLAHFQGLTTLDPDLSELDKIIAYITVLTGIPTEEVLDLSLPDFKQLQAVIMTLLNTERQQIPTFTWEYSGVTYGMQHLLTKITAGEFIDLDTLTSDQDNFLSHLHVLMAILFRPLKKGPSTLGGTDFTLVKYRHEDLETRAPIMMHMPMNVVWGAIFFFQLYASKLHPATMGYFRELVQKQTTQMTHLWHQTMPPSASSAGLG